MDKKLLDTLGLIKKKQIAVAYLLGNVAERPEGTNHLFDKLDKTQKSAQQIEQAIMEAKQTIIQLGIEFNQSVGSMATLIDLITEQIPDEQAQQCCEKYNPPPEFVLPGGKQPAPSRIIKPKMNLDMAGSTAQNITPPPKEQ